MITEALDVPVDRFQRDTGWQLKPEGACKGEICVPLPEGSVVDGKVRLGAVADRLGMPVVHDDSRNVIALGPESISGHALTTAEAPELTLPTIDGEPFSLSSLRGQKVLLVAWAPY